MTCTGQNVSSGPVSTRFLRPSSISARVKMVASPEYSDGISKKLLAAGQVRLDQVNGEIRRRRDQHHAADARAFAGPRQFLHHAQRHPCAHRRADQHLRSFGQLAEDGEALRQPFGDRSVGEGAAGFAVTGIVVPDIGVAGFFGPAVQRLGLDATHLGAVSAEPGDARLAALAATPADVHAVDFEMMGQVLVHGARRIRSDGFLHSPVWRAKGQFPAMVGMDAGDLFVLPCY